MSAARPLPQREDDELDERALLRELVAEVRAMRAELACPRRSRPCGDPAEQGARLLSAIAED